MTKILETAAFQGDMLITKIDKLPEDLIKSQSEGGNLILTHSETGHHHVVNPNDAEMFTSSNDDFKVYLKVHNETELRHLRDFDTHETIKLPPGIYRINRQREYTPEGFRKAQD